MNRAVLSLWLMLTSLAPVSHAQADTQVALHTSKGRIVVALDEQQAPRSSANFLDYVASGHYDGTLFHRVIPGFMIQGGGYDADYVKKRTRAPIANEADNGLRNERGTLAMARTADPHSATAQFFINVTYNGFLNHRAKHDQGWGYAVFGRDVSGMAVVDDIVNTPTGSGGPFRQNAPRSQVVIEKAEILP